MNSDCLWLFRNCLVSFGGIKELNWADRSRIDESCVIRGEILRGQPFVCSPLCTIRSNRSFPVHYPLLPTVRVDCALTGHNCSNLLITSQGVKSALTSPSIPAIGRSALSPALGPPPTPTPHKFQKSQKTVSF